SFLHTYFFILFSSHLYNVSFFFFFSSRRRHTRYWRDWSSDVCSSDLPEEAADNRRGWAGCSRHLQRAGARRYRSRAQNLTFNPSWPWRGLKTSRGVLKLAT